jgi:hypothetical protein
MAKEKNIGDIFWIIVAWILATAFAYIILVKMKLLFHLMLAPSLIILFVC